MPYESQGTVALTRNQLNYTLSKVWINPTHPLQVVAGKVNATVPVTDLLLQEKRQDISRADELFPVLRALCFLPRPTVEDEVEYKKEAIYAFWLWVTAINQFQKCIENV